MISGECWHSSPYFFYKSILPQNLRGCCYQDDSNHPFQNTNTTRSGKSTIQFQLVISLRGVLNLEVGQLWRTRRPVMTHHKVRDLGMHVQLAESAPSLGGPGT